MSFLLQETLFFCHYMEKISPYINISNWPKWIRKWRHKSSILYSCNIQRTIVSFWHQMTFYNVRHCVGNLVCCCVNGQFVDNSKTNLQVNYSFTVQTVHLHVTWEIKICRWLVPFSSFRWWKMDSKLAAKTNEYNMHSFSFLLIGPSHPHCRSVVKVYACSCCGCRHYRVMQSASSSACLPVWFLASQLHSAMGTHAPWTPWLTHRWA